MAPSSCNSLPPSLPVYRPTQSPDGAFLPEDVPYAQLLRAMQPDARLILTLSDPVRRLYSDYYFLDDRYSFPLPPSSLLYCCFYTQTTTS